MSVASRFICFNPWQQPKHPVALKLVSTSAKRTALLRRNVNNALLHNAQSVAFNAATSIEHAELTNKTGNVTCDDIEFPINDFDNCANYSMDLSYFRYWK